MTARIRHAKTQSERKTDWGEAASETERRLKRKRNRNKVKMIDCAKSKKNTF